MIRLNSSLLDQLKAQPDLQSQELGDKRRRQPERRQVKKGRFSTLPLPVRSLSLLSLSPRAASLSLSPGGRGWRAKRAG
jgi:hypothetical protein